MGRAPMPARLWPRKDPKPGKWLILDNVDGQRVNIDTKCVLADTEGAARKLAEYLAQKARDGDAQAKALAAKKAARTKRPPEEWTFAELALWACRFRAPEMARPAEYIRGFELLADYVDADETLDVLLDDGWVDGFVAHVGSAARARRVLEDLRAAMRNRVNNHKLTYAPPIVLPDKSQPRPDYLTWEEVLALCRTAWREYDEQMRPTGPRPKVEGDAPQVRRLVVTKRKRWRHLVPYILVSVLTCTRASRVFEASYVHEVDRPWIDLERGRYRRLGEEEVEQHNKRAPEIPIPDRLLKSMRRWAGGEPGGQDGHLRFGKNYLVQYLGRPVDCRKSFEACVEKARKLYPDLFKRETGTPKNIVRHTLRHTGVTLLSQWGVPSGDICDYAGMSPEVFRKVYKHIDAAHMDRVMDAMGGKAKPAKVRRARKPKPEQPEEHV